MSEKTALAERMTVARKHLGLTQSEMAGKLQVNFRAYQTYEQSAREPKATNLSEYGTVGISIHWLLTGDGSMLTERGTPSAAAFLDRLKVVVPSRIDADSLATATKIPEKRMKTLMRGKSAPTGDEVDAIAAVTGIDPCWLRTGEEPPQGDEASRRKNGKSDPIGTQTPPRYTYPGMPEPPVRIGDCDVDILTQAIDVFEDWNRETGASLPTSRQAQIIARIYDLIADDTRDGRSVDIPRIRNFLHLLS